MPRKEPKMGLLVIFLGLTQWFDLILHILIVPNDPHDGINQVLHVSGYLPMLKIECHA